MKLAQLIVQYVAFRKSLGQDFESDGKRLRTFSRFVGESAATDSTRSYNFSRSTRHIRKS